MALSLAELFTHDSTEDCIACRARDFVAQIVVPAAEAWETSTDLPRFSIALHGAAGLLGSMLEEGVSRENIESALSRLLDELGEQLTENRAMGGPPQGTA
jgi:hypothetical protein